MRAPLHQFAERIIRNGEVREFIRGLVEMGVSPVNILEAALPYKDTTLASLNTLAASGTPLAVAWLEAISALRRGDTQSFFALPSYEWQLLEERIPEVADLLRKHAPRR